MLTPADEEFIRGFRDRKNMLGAAVQLCTLPWLGFVPDDVPAAPAVAVARLPERLGIPVGELRGYGAREQTRTGHLREVAAHLGWHQVDGPRWKDLEEFLFARALEHDSPKLLFRLACEYLSSSRLIRPGVVHVLQRVATARKRARGETWQRVEPMLTWFLRGELDGMLVPGPLLGRTRPAAWPHPAGLAGDRAGLVGAGGGEGRAGEDVTAYRHYWELCVLMALRDGLRSGDVHVPGSRRYAGPASFLLTPQQWEPQRLEYCHLVGKKPTAADALALANDELHAALADLEAQLARGGGKGEVRPGKDGELIIPPR